MGPIEMLIAYEQGELDENDTRFLFQCLIDSGMAWQLQGSYGRMAARLIECGMCKPFPRNEQEGASNALH